MVQTWAAVRKALECDEQNVHQRKFCQSSWSFFASFDCPRPALSEQHVNPKLASLSWTLLKVEVTVNQEGGLAHADLDLLDNGSA